MQAKEEWWFPEYMKEKCPGLPNWEALKEPACAEAFSTAETAPKGRYLGGPVTWGGFDEERVEALGLPFEVVHAGTDAALFAELECAYQRQAPIMLWIYSPHWAPAKYEGEWVEFPAYARRVLRRPGGGAATPTPPMTAASRSARSGRSAGPGSRTSGRAPTRRSRRFTIDNAEMGAMITEVDLDGKTVEEVADAWIAANEARWSDLDPVVDPAAERRRASPLRPAPPSSS